MTIEVKTNGVHKVNVSWLFYAVTILVGLLGGTVGYGVHQGQLESRVGVLERDVGENKITLHTVEDRQQVVLQKLAAIEVLSGEIKDHLRQHQRMTETAPNTTTYRRRETTQHP